MLKDKIKKWLDRMAKANEAQFGKGRRLECCDLNQKGNNTSSKKLKKKL